MTLLRCKCDWCRSWRAFLRDVGLMLIMAAMVALAVFVAGGRWERQSRMQDAETRADHDWAFGGRGRR
jgi:hypothetical protein